MGRIPERLELTGRTALLAGHERHPGTQAVACDLDAARRRPNGHGETLDREAFIHAVAPAAELDAEGAERATRAVLQTLAERIDRGEARDLAARLPAEVAPWIAIATAVVGMTPASSAAIEYCAPSGAARTAATT
jgi:hypothetical protein